MSQTSINLKVQLIMLIIEYHPVSFPEKFGAKLTTPSTLRCSWSDLVWAAITVGRKSLRHVIQPRTYSYFEMIHRSTILYANLQAADYRPGLWGPADTHLLQSPAYKNLHPSEKSARSYFLGLTTAKLFAEKLLDVPWLIHLDTYSQRLNADHSRAWLPDLVGVDKKTKWVVAEAKGRSNWLDKSALKKAKKRAKALTSIAGQRPGLQVGFSSYFSGNDKILKVYLEDPQAKNENGSDLSITLDTYLSDYYSLIFDFLTSEYGGPSTSATYGNRTYRIKSIDEADMRLGLDEQVYALVQSDDRSLSDNLAATLSDVSFSQDKSEGQITVGHDGIYVQLGDGWREDRMYLPPPERTA